MGKRQGDPCIMNLWVHDGSKDITVNRMKYRALLKDSLDQIFATKYDNMKDCIESKVFGIGLESYTVGQQIVHTSRNTMGLFLNLTFGSERMQKQRLTPNTISM